MYLLDTCTLLWLAGNAHGELSKKAREIITGFPGHLAISAISALEIGIKARQGKIVLQTDPRTWFATAVKQHGLHEIPVHGSIAAASTMLPSLHKDPCDRVIIATAQFYVLTILTPDDRIARYPGVATIW
jgi:PIN domain nuclease of toxin-antitoxin system